ncbi:MAG: hypothetical protein GX786_10050 [Clostridiales bacterium]|nr:hypothetical protein [Clostridiales bacterium]
MNGYKIDQAMKRRIEDIAYQSLYGRKTTFTHFLTPPEYHYGFHFGKNLSLHVMGFGGYESAERQVLGFEKENPLSPAMFPIQSLTITWDSPFAQIGHRDLLGGILAVGIDRKHIGDIVIGNQEAQVYITGISPFLFTQQLTMVGKTRVEVKETDTVKEVEEKKRERNAMVMNHTVASLRADIIIAVAFGIKREIVSQLVDQKAVKVNHLALEKKEKTLTCGDLLSIRGYGRIQLVSIGNPNRKKRIPIELLIYGK